MNVDFGIQATRKADPAAAVAASPSTNLDAAVVLADEAHLETVRAMLPPSLAVVSLQEWAAQMQHCVAATSDSAPAEVTLPDRELLAVVIGERTAPAAMTLVQRIDPSVPLCRFAAPDDGTAAALLGTVTERLAVLLARARLTAASAKRSLGLLRRDYDRLQGTFSEVEQFLYTLGGPKLSLCVEYPPTIETTVLSSNSAKGERATACLVNRLPTYAAGIVAVELAVREVSGRGVIKLVLEDLAGTALAETEAEVGGGKRATALTLPFRHSTARLFRDCSLRLTAVASGKEGLSVTLALSSPHPQPAYCASIDRDRVLAAPLAMRVWRGLPDTTPPPSLQPPFADSVFLRPGQLPRPRLLVCDDPNIGFEVASYWAKEDAVLVHPPARGMTIVLIPSVSTALNKIGRVGAIVHHGHQDGPPLRFAVAAVPAGFGDKVNARALLSNWISLPALAWGEVHAALERPIVGDLDLILATITAQGEVNDKAWGLFRGFMLFA